MTAFDNLGVSNFRIFNGDAKVNLAPITVFTGKNNSGKSSFLKLLALLKENFTSVSIPNSISFKNTENHHLGSFSLCLNSESGSDSLNIYLPLDLKYFNEKMEMVLTYGKSSSRVDQGDISDIQIKSSSSEKVLMSLGSKTYINYPWIISTFDSLRAKQSGIIIKKAISFEEFEAEQGKSEAINLKPFPENVKQSKEDLIFKNDPSFFLIPDELKDRSVVDDLDKKGIDFGHFLNEQEPLDSLAIGSQAISGSSIPDHLVHHYDKYCLKLNRNVDKMTEDEYYDYTISSFIDNNNGYYYAPTTNLVDWIVLELLINNIVSAIRNLSESITKLAYLPSSRIQLSRSLVNSYESPAPLQKYIYRFLKITFENDDPRLIFLNQWISKFGLGNSIDIQHSKDGERSVISIKSDDGTDKNIADLGYGFNQILPLILCPITESISTIDDKDQKVIICVEEPEANLHPNLQSLVADFLIDAAYRFNIQWIIETHSEYFIRKLQYWIAKKLIKPESVKFIILTHLKPSISLIWSYSRMVLFAKILVMGSLMNQQNGNLNC